MSFLHEPGDLARTPLAAVLIEALNLRATGLLTVQHGGGTSKVYLRDGIPVASQSFTGFKPLGHVLLAAGAIDVAQLDRSLEHMASKGKQQGEVLVEMGAVTPAQVAEALALQQEAYLAQIAELGAGSFAFDPGQGVPEWTRAVRIRPLRAIVAAMQKPQAGALVVSALQPVATETVALSSAYLQLAPAFGWNAAEAALVESLRDPTRLEAFFARTGVPPERARAILAVLLLLGLASARARASAPGDSVVDLVVEIGDIQSRPAEAEGERAPSEPAPDPPEPPKALRRSDPEEARQRRQRLLQRAMQNMGVGPLSGQPPHDSARSRPSGQAAEAPPTAPPPPTPAERELRRALEAAEPRAASGDLCERLGLPRTATGEQVRQAYFQLAKQLHPDRFTSPALAGLAPRVKDLFAALNEAYEVLKDDRKRADWLARSGGEQGASRPGAAPGAAASGAAADFKKAEACFRTRDFARARGFYEAAVRADPRPEYQAAFAWALVSDPNPDLPRARQLLEAAQRDPSCDRAAYLSGVLARDAGDLAKAEAHFRAALKANPRNTDADREVRFIEMRRARSGTTGVFRRK